MVQVGRLTVLHGIQIRTLHTQRVLAALELPDRTLSLAKEWLPGLSEVLSEQRSRGIVWLFW
jgi:hypothetical protein